MKVVVFGGKGMAGHMIVDYLTQRGYDVWYTVREHSNEPRACRLNVVEHSDVEKLLLSLKPDIVINAVGLLNDDAARRKRETIYVNSLFPHQLSYYGTKFGFRLIHISTDCVFSGKTGDYTELAVPDGVTIYSKSKSLGEVTDPPNITIRTSIIGPELKTNGIGLFNWFMQQKGEITGYHKVFWNGVTTLELAKAIEWALQNSVSGLVHLAVPQKISKYDLLVLLKRVYQRDDIIIRSDDHIQSDKSLVNTSTDFNYEGAAYEKMLQQLKAWMEQSKRDYPYKF